MAGIKIALTGEGNTDYGEYGFNKKTGNMEWFPGPLVPLIQHTAALLKKECEIDLVDKHDVLKMKTQRTMKKMNGLGGKAKDSARYALYLKLKGYQYGIFYCDADKENGKKNTDENVCKKLYADVRGEIEEGIEATRSSEQKIIAMVALKMIECWLLADVKAIGVAIGEQPEKIKLPPYPELIWGTKDDPKSNYPKHYLKRVLNPEKKKGMESNRDTFYQIADAIDVKILSKRCPISFHHFEEDLSGMLE